MKQSLPLLFAALLLIGVNGCKPSDKSSDAGKSSAKSTVKGGSVDSDETFQITSKWNVGSRFVHRMDLDIHSDIKLAAMPNTMKQEMKMGQTYAVEVLKELEGGRKQVSTEILGHEIEMKMDGKLMMDLDSKSKDDKDNPFGKVMSSVIGNKITMTLTSSNTLENIENFDAWLDKVSAKNPQGRQMVQQTYNREFFQRLFDVSAQMGQKPVKKGEPWTTLMEVPAGGGMGNISLSLTNVIKDLEMRENRRCLVIASEGSMSSPPGSKNLKIESGSFKGTSWFDLELGQQVEVDMDQKMKMEIEMPPGQGPPGKVSVNMIQNIKMKLVEATTK